jgi:glycosyltransferase involved in cell wall biosynthesis
MTLRTLHIGRVWQSEQAGGADRVLFDLARYLPSYDVSVEAVVAGPVPSQDASVFSFGSNELSTKARWLGARKIVFSRLNAGRVDLIASHFALYASSVLDRLYRIPHVVHFQGPWAAESLQEGAGRLSTSVKWSLERLVLASAERVIVMSEAFASLVQTSYGVGPDRVRVVPGAVDLQAFTVVQNQSEARDILGLPKDRPLLATVRRLIHRTGVDRLIDALPAIVKEFPRLLLCIGGRGPLRSVLERRVATHGLQDHVRFLGYVQEGQLPILYRAADFNVVPTLALEGFGLTAVEALAAGTPSLVTPIGGLPETVRRLSPSLVFRSADTADMADGILGALSGSASIPTKEQCQTYAREHFSAELMAQRIAAVYREVRP